MDKQKGLEHITLRLPKTTLQKIDKYCLEKKLNRSDVIRKMIDEGLKIKSYTEDIDFIRNIIREEIKTTIEPYLNRIIKITNKTGYSATASWFVMIDLYEKIYKGDSYKSFLELVEESKKKAHNYIKNKVGDL